MVTLIAVYNSEGCQGRCDARCYNAGGPDCECICGGMNHGKGHSRAMDNTRQAFEQMIENYQKDHAFTEIEVPAVYTAHTRTAVKIARAINAEAGYNKVLDVRRVDGLWEVDLKPYREWTAGSYGLKKTHFFKSLKEVQAATPKTTEALPETPTLMTAQASLFPL